MEEAANFYERYLFTNEGKFAWAYLAKRGLSSAEIKKFRIGFSPSPWDLLYRFLKGKGVGEKDMEALGLITRKGKGSYYDWFRERVIFPIMNETGKIVAFGGRTMKEVEPKYLNSPETPIYRKGMVLYGLNMAKKGILREKKAIIVEGYMDLISLFQFGFDYSIATLGTALTPMHLKALKRFNPELILGYDADKAGVEATKRAIEEALKQSFTVKVLNFSSDKDPDRYLRSAGMEAMAGLIREAPDFFSFYIKNFEAIYNVNTNAGRIRIIKGMTSVIRFVQDAVEKDIYIKQISERYSISEESLKTELKNTGKDYEIGSGATRKSFSREREIARIILSGGELSTKARKYLTVEDFEDEDIRDIIKAVEKVGSNHIPPDALLEEFEENRRSLITGILLEELSGISPEAMLDEFILNAEKRRLSKKSALLLQDIRREEKNGNLAKVREKQREYQELIKGRGV
jgi:DNA primase